MVALAFCFPFYILYGDGFQPRFNHICFFFAQPPASIKNDLLIIGVDNYLFNQRLKVIWFIIPFKDCYSLLVLAPTVPVNILAMCEGTPRWTWESWQRSSKSCTLATGRRAGEVVRYGGSLQDTPDGFFYQTWQWNPLHINGDSETHGKSPVNGGFSG